MPITKRPYDLVCDLCTSKLGELSDEEYTELMAKREAEDYKPLMSFDLNGYHAEAHVLCDHCRDFLKAKVLPRLVAIGRPRRAQGQKRTKK